MVLVPIQEDQNVGTRTSELELRNPGTGTTTGTSELRNRVNLGTDTALVLHN